MTGKKTAVFGIFHTGNQAERGVDRLQAAGFSNDDISVLLQDCQVPRTLHTRRIQKRRKGPLRELSPAEQSGEPLDCWPESALLPFREWVRLSRPDRSWSHLRVWGPAARSVVSLAR